MLQQVLGKYPQEVKLVYKNFPLALHRFAKKAAIAALAANKQGKFWEFHRKLFENHKTLDDGKIQEIAGRMGLDMERFTRDMTNPAFQRLIIRDVRDGQRAGVFGLPTVFVNGKLWKNQSPQGFAEMIKAELRKKNRKESLH
jgi:protein-disulfide isomerase